MCKHVRKSLCGEPLAKVSDECDALVEDILWCAQHTINTKTKELFVRVKQS